MDVVHRSRVGVMLQRQIEGDLVGKELGFETLEPTTMANRTYDDLTNGNVDSRPFSQRCFLDAGNT